MELGRAGRWGATRWASGLGFGLGSAEGLAASWTVFTVLSPPALCSFHCSLPCFPHQEPGVKPFLPQAAFTGYSVPATMQITTAPSRVSAACHHHPAPTPGVPQSLHRLFVPSGANTFSGLLTPPLLPPPFLLPLFLFFSSTFSVSPG